LDDELLRDVKRVAAERGTTMTQVIEDALRVMLLDRRGGEHAPKIKLPVSKRRGGIRPGVDISNNAAVRDLMDEEYLREGKIEKLR
jgi:hypothetical protein